MRCKSNQDRKKLLFLHWNKFYKVSVNPESKINNFSVESRLKKYSHLVWLWLLRYVIPKRKSWYLKTQTYLLFIWFNLFYRYVWPWAKKDAMQHDSFLCRKYSGTRGFPIQRKNQTNNFMAAVVAQNQYIWKPCPTKCRPEAHKDWEYCWWTIYQITRSTEIRIIPWFGLACIIQKIQNVFGYSKRNIILLI